jgi:hypothetical protein
MEYVSRMNGQLHRGARSLRRVPEESAPVLERQRELMRVHVRRASGLGLLAERVHRLTQRNSS